MSITPVCYHVPILFGHSGEYFTYYITKGYPDFIKPTDTAYQRIVEPAKPLNRWFVTFDRFESVNEYNCRNKDSNHHWLCPLPDMVHGFESPEEALEALELYFTKTEKPYTII